MMEKAFHIAASAFAFKPPAPFLPLIPAEIDVVYRRASLKMSRV